MRFRVPRPMHGWREFTHEVIIVVIGVAIALGADQLVRSANDRDKVAKAERALRAELIDDDGAQAYARLAIHPCLVELSYRIHNGAGQLPPAQLRQLIGLYTPPFRTWDSETWKAVLSSEIASDMAPDRLVAWSAAYRGMELLGRTNDRETELMLQLREALPPDPAAALSADKVAHIRLLAAQLRGIDQRISASSSLLLTRGEALAGPLPTPVKLATLRRARELYGNCSTAPPARRPQTDATSIDANLMNKGARTAFAPR